MVVRTMALKTVPFKKARLQQPPANSQVTREHIMNLEKSKKRIAKRVKMGFKGYPEISISYCGHSPNHAEQVVVSFVAEQGEQAMTEKFTSKADAREDEVIQSAIVKMIERSEAKTVLVAESIALMDT